MQELDYVGIGMRIRRKRKEKGLSQDDLAKECGICLSFMGHIERGTRHMSLETFANICKILDADTEEMLWGITNHSLSAVLDMWNPPGKDGNKKKPDRKTGNQTDDRQSDSFEMYVRIMKSVAEIMNAE